MSQKSYDETPTLYLVPTPIGNLDDITFRSLEILKSVKVVFSEDTRITKILFNKYDIKTPLMSCHEYNEKEIKDKVIEILNNGENIALVTDRGTPIISDPGYIVAREVIEKKFNLVTLPGATALIPALVSSGIAPYPFLFYGFLNSSISKRKKEIEKLKKNKETLVFYESPKRILKTIELVKEIMGNRQISISREISKKFEEVYRGTIKEIFEDKINLKGEFVLVVEGSKEEESFQNLSIEEHVYFYIEQGMTKNEAIKKAASDRKVKKNEVYKKINKN